LTSESTPKKQ